MHGLDHRCTIYPCAHPAGSRQAHCREQRDTVCYHPALRHSPLQKSLTPALTPSKGFLLLVHLLLSLFLLLQSSPTATPPTVRKGLLLASGLLPQYNSRTLQEVRLSRAPLNVALVCKGGRRTHTRLRAIFTNQPRGLGGLYQPRALCNGFVSTLEIGVVCLFVAICVHLPIYICIVYLFVTGT